MSLSLGHETVAEKLVRPEIGPRAAWRRRNLYPSQPALPTHWRADSNRSRAYLPGFMPNYMIWRQSLPTKQQLASRNARMTQMLSTQSFHAKQNLSATSRTK